MPDPQQLQQQIQALNDQLEILNDNFGNISNKINTDLKKALSDLSVDAGEFINKFENGQKVTSSLGTKLIAIQKQANRLSIDRNDIDLKLKQALADRNYKQQKILEKQLAENKYATQQLELSQSLLIKLKQIVDEEDNRKKKLEEEEKLEKSIYNQINKRYKFLKDNLSGLFTYLVTAFKVVNQATTDMAKSMGVAEESAKKYVDQFDRYVKKSQDGFISIQKLAAAQTELTTQLGFSARFSEQELETFSRLTKIVGLTADEAGRLTEQAAATGKENTEYVADLRRAAFFAQQTAKVHITDKELLSSISKLSAGILVKFQNNPKALAEAVVQAKKLGINLEQVNKIGTSMLEWESSIENELEAELITGRKLNFERARAAALTGDQAALMQEVASQAGSLAEYEEMNVIARESLAKAFGMSSDEMSEMLMKQEAINKYGDKAAELNKEQLDYMQRHNLTADQMLEKVNNQRSSQEKFNDAMEKLQGIVGNLVEGPFGKLATLLADMLGTTGGLLTLTTAYIARLGAILALKLIEIKYQKQVARGAITEAAAKAATSAAAIPVIGAGLGLVAAAAAVAYFSGMFDKADDFISPGYGKRMIFSPEGAVALNNQDTIVAGTNLGGGGINRTDGNAGMADGIAVSPNINRTDGNAGMAGVMAAISNLATAVANKPTPTPQFALNVDGQQLGSVVGRQQETGTQQTKNAYRLA
jgi:hypothetical protein